MMQRLLRRRTETGDFVQTQQKGKAASRVVEAPPGGQTKGGATPGGGDEPRMPRILRALIRRFRGIEAKHDIPAPAIEDLAPEAAPALLPSRDGQFVVGSYANFAGMRHFRLYIPSAYRGQPLPLIVMLHGCKQSPEDFAAGTRMNLIAEEVGCFVAYPGQPKFANNSQCWNWFSPRHQHRGRGEPSIIAGITRRIVREYGIDACRVYIAGLSAGGAATAVMAATYPDVYAAAGIHSGLARGAARNVPTAFAAMRNGTGSIPDMTPLAPGPAGQRTLVPTIVFHGDRDDTVHLRNTDQVIEQIRLGAGVDLREASENGRTKAGRGYSRALYRDGSGKAVVERWIVHDSGHAWSGGSSAGSYTDPLGPDASREMVRFFLEHRLPADLV
jgi:poly(hydroxyalkanoate) depolymerase family esterase